MRTLASVQDFTLSLSEYAPTALTYSVELLVFSDTNVKETPCWKDDAQSTLRFLNAVGCQPRFIISYNHLRREIAKYRRARANTYPEPLPFTFPHPFSGAQC